MKIKKTSNQMQKINILSLLGVVFLFNGCIQSGGGIINTPEQARKYVLESKKKDDFKKTISYTISDYNFISEHESCNLTLKSNIRDGIIRYKFIFQPSYQVGAGQIAKNHFFNQGAYYFKGFDSDGETSFILNYQNDRKYMNVWTGNHIFYENYESDISNEYIKSHLTTGVKIKIETKSEKNNRICKISSLKLEALYKIINK